jgi:SAM-dependent methyltransferase
MANGPPRIFDRHAVALHQARARAIAGEMFFVRQAAEGLAQRLDAVRRTFSNALELDGSEVSAGLLVQRAEHWTRQALADESVHGGPQQFDLVASVLSLHAVNDLPGVLFQIRRVLKPDGLFVAALFAGETLRELRESLAAGELETLGGISPRVAPFADVRQLGGLLQRAGFALPVADVERTVVRYREFQTLVADLRAMGESNALHERSRKPSRRSRRAASRHVRDRVFDGLVAARKPAATAEAGLRGYATGKRAEHDRAKRRRSRAQTLEVGGERIENEERCSDLRDTRDDQNGDQARDQRILDGRRAAYVTQQRR